MQNAVHLYFIDTYVANVMGNYCQWLFPSDLFGKFIFKYA
jgi:hypothetical protein